MEKRFNKLDLGSGIFWNVVGLVILANSLEISIGTAKSPGPGFYPFILGICLMGISSLLIIQILLGRPWGSANLGPLFKFARTPAVILGSMVLFIFLLNSIGFIIDVFLLTFTVYEIIAQHGSVLRRMLIGFLFASLATFGCWLLFCKAFELPLP